MIKAPTIINKHGVVSRENMLHAFNRLVTLGILVPTGKQKLDSQGNARTGRLYAKYAVVKSREEALGVTPEPVTLPPVPAPATRVTYVTTPAPANTAPASSSNVKSLEQRVAALETRLTELTGHLHSV